MYHNNHTELYCEIKVKWMLMSDQKLNLKTIYKHKCVLKTQALKVQKDISYIHKHQNKVKPVQSLHFYILNVSWMSCATQQSHYSCAYWTNRNIWTQHSSANMCLYNNETMCMWWGVKGSESLTCIIRLHQWLPN